MDLAGLVNISAVILRIGLASVFITRGYPKLFGGPLYPKGPEDFAKVLKKLKIPQPEFFAWSIAVLEFIGGLFILIGFLTPLVSLLLSIELAFSIYKIYWKAGFIGGWEYKFILLVISASLLFLGPGNWSVDGVLAR